MMTLAKCVSIVGVFSLQWAHPTITTCLTRVSLVNYSLIMLLKQKIKRIKERRITDLDGLSEWGLGNKSDYIWA